MHSLATAFILCPDHNSRLQPINYSTLTQTSSFSAALIVKTCCGGTANVNHVNSSVSQRYNCAFGVCLSKPSYQTTASILNMLLKMFLDRKRKKKKNPKPVGQTSGPRNVWP